jgi:hypothetical protein
MKLKKILALLLSAVMIAAVFTGCKQTTKSPFVSSGSATPSGASAAAASPSAAALNYEKAYASLDPKTVMMTIDGKDVQWDELFYYITYSIYQVESQGGQISDWSAIMKDETTYKDYVLNSAANFALQNEAINYGAKQLNVALSDKDKTDLQTDYDTQVSSSGGEEAFLAQLKEGYITKEIYNMLSEIGYLSKDCFTALYGDDGSKLSDKDVADYTASDNYIMAKHILFMTVTTDESGNTNPISDAEKAKVREKAEAVLTELKNYKGKDFDAYFDELMNANSEDKGGLSSFPNGYLFKSGDMVTEFDNAAKALQIGQFTPELVESTVGYHIIYRLPIDYNTTPIENSSSGNQSLRFIAAYDMYLAVTDTWLNSLNVTYSNQYKALDLEKLFAAG